MEHYIAPSMLKIIASGKAGMLDDDASKQSTIFTVEFGKPLETPSLLLVLIHTIYIHCIGLGSLYKHGPTFTNGKNNNIHFQETLAGL